MCNTFVFTLDSIHEGSEWVRVVLVAFIWVIRCSMREGEEAEAGVGCSGDPKAISLSVNESFPEPLGWVLVVEGLGRLTSGEKK